MKEIRTQDAVGHVLCHDLTQIIPGVTKDAAFRKGHVVVAEDIPVLLSMGKEHLYVWEQQPGMIHENDGADILYHICAGENMTPSPVKEGKIDVIAGADGLLTVDVERMRQINSLGEMMIASRHSHFPVCAGDKLAGTRIIPLMIREERMVAAKEIGGGVPLLALHPFTVKKAAVITTGSEVYQGLIQDKFTPVIEGKLQEYGGEIVYRKLLPDDPAAITQAILESIHQGAEMVICTGGMSVDPDDRTPLAIKNTDAEIISYGAPVLPGAMFLLAYYGENRIPIMGLPGCVMYAGRTIFDLVLCRVMAGVPVTPQQLAGMGHGGLCLRCEPCTYPNCGFGKGV